ncbi:hypothetical protein T35B1_18583 [Salinisphaera shabanensis T35B1]
MTALRHELQAIVEQIDFLYRDPATKNIPWFQLIPIAEDRIEGKNVSDRLEALIMMNISGD